METDEALRERFDRALDGFATRPGDVARVAARARQRARRQRAVGAIAGVTAVIAAAVLVPRLVSPAGQLTVDPVSSPTAPAAATPTTADQGTAEAPLSQDHVRYGVDGVVRHRGGESTSLSSQPTERAFGLRDGGVVVQLGQGGPIDRISADGEPTSVVPASHRGAPRLLTVHDERIWFTVRESTAGGEDEERLRSVPVDGGEATDHGVSAGVESFTDALAFLPGGGAAWLSCHLQCSVFVGGGPPTDPGARTTDRAGWYAGLTVAAAGDRLGLVDGPDPVLGGTSDVVVLDVDGRELVRLRLPVGLALDRAHVEFTAGGEDLVVGDDAHAFVVRAWASDAPKIIGLEEDAGIALLPTTAVPPDAAADVARDLADRGLGWTAAAVGPPQVRDGGTWVPVGVDGDRPASEVLVEEIAGEPTVTSGGDLAGGPEDTSGWWFGLSAEDGRIAVAGRAPAGAPGVIEVSVWSPRSVRTTATSSPRSDDGSFDVELDVPAQTEEDVVLLLLTRDGGMATSFALVRVPAGPFAAG